MNESRKDKKSFGWRLVLPALVVGAVIVAGWILWKPGRKPGKIRNVVLISIDTCRADYLSCYGYPSKTTPNIDKLTEEGVLFSNVITPIPTTLPAHSSMLTGTIPPYHGVRDNMDYRLGQSNVTLAEILKEAGFATAAVIGAFVLDSRFQLDQGFESYNDTFDGAIENEQISQRRGEEVNRFAIEWLDQHGNEDFFLFLHYYDPHDKYLPPEPFASEFAENLYAGEIAYTDFCFGQVIKKLKELALYDSTLIIITGDHGEMLGEHDERDHGYFIYQSAIKVPLIFKLPGQNTSQKVNSIVGLVDIVPTVCSLLGVELASDVHGVDLSGSFGRGRLPDDQRYLYCESLTPTRFEASALLGVVTERFKYIQTARPELYDLTTDPGEISNLIKTQSQQVRILKSHLKQILTRSVSKDSSDSKLELDGQTLERLKGLGYVGGSVREDFEFDKIKDDPKDFIHIHNAFQKASELDFQNKHDQAKVICKELIFQRPQFLETSFFMASKSIDEGDFAAAINYLKIPLELKPDNFRAQHDMGVALAMLGKYDEAVEHFKKALLIRPHDPKVFNSLGTALLWQEEYSEAIGYFNKILEIDPDSAEAHLNMGQALTGQKQYDRAVKHFNAALQAKPNWPQAYHFLGMLYVQQNRFDLAIENWTEVLRLNPNFLKVLNNLAWILATCPDEELLDCARAVKLAKRACELTNYQYAVSLDTLSVAYAAAGRFDEAVETAEKALQLALVANQQRLADEIQKRIEFYQAGRPWREAPKK